ncbi:hypothetical protein ONZ43_g7119 [Nemania bipapillata]|uniref:Uncharacterized protein n=1 Tax=Nemania bipapillata TaxID=110536 RepID=A0ACC2HT79_9PEZI|nr:hypothetical protein ONZ43_g7119 [Nemania bipapillata]
MVLTREEDGEEAEDGDPEDEEDEVPGEEAGRLDEGLGDGEEHGGDGAEGRDEEGVDPRGGLRVAGAAVRVHARPVQAHDDEGEDELETAADETEPGLIDVDGLCYGALAELGGE